MGTYSGGDGSSGTPYLIASVADWEELAATSADWVDGKFFEQSADIDFTAADATHVGTDLTGFGGQYDGNGKVMSNITVAPTAGNHSALFQVLLSTGILENIIIQTGESVGSSLDADSSYTAMLVGETNNGAIVQDCVLIDCTVSNTHTQTSSSNLGYIGIVAGANHGITQRCKVIGGLAKGDRVGAGAADLSLGSVVGLQTKGEAADGYCRDCISSANVEDMGAGLSDATVSVGGIVGTCIKSTFFGIVENCSYTGILTYNSTEAVYAGGIAGTCNSQVLNCISTGAITVDTGAKTIMIGGVAGRINGSNAIVHNSKSYSNITATTISTLDVGGIVGNGDLDFTMTNCYYQGLITPNGAGPFVGGILGSMKATFGVTMDSCSAEVYINVATTATEYIAGGLGLVSEGIITNCIVKGGLIVNGTTNLAAVAFFGGFVAFSSEDATFEQCLAIFGPWDGATSNRGGFCGRLNTLATFNNCYWDTDVAGHAVAGYAIEATTAELQVDSLPGFVTTGPDVKWVMEEGKYPELAEYNLDLETVLAVDNNVQYEGNINTQYGQNNKQYGPE